jgi:hypothetical protein
VDLLSLDEFARWLGGPDGQQPPGDHAVLVDLTAPEPAGLDQVTERMAAVPYVVVGVGPDPQARPAFADVVTEPADLPSVLAGIERAPIAAAALALLLRGASHRTVAEGLIAESTTYSMLQAGPEFAAWRAGRPPRLRGDTGPTVHTERVGAVLRVTLHRPRVRNALNARMRDELVEALTIAEADPAVSIVELDGVGPAFCAGGDLDEFGARTEPASAHLIRLTHSPAMLLSRLAPRVTARLHGACYGSGIELPAFAARVVAAPDTRIALPELHLGLIPGAGGTVSLPRRIGRHRTAWLALTGAAIDAGTALAWGLVDAVEERV